MGVSEVVDRKQRRKQDRRLEKAERKGRMKQIKFEEEFLGATGQPFYILDPDVKVQKKARDEAYDEARRAALEKRPPRPIQPPQIEATFSTIMTWFVDNIPHNREDDPCPKCGAQQSNPKRKVSIEDAGNAYAVIKAFRGHQNGVVDMEDAVYKWLVELIDMDGTAAFTSGSTATVIKERILNTVQA